MKNENRASRKGSFFWTTQKTPRSDAPARAQSLRQRSFKIIRKPDLIGLSFLFNNVRVAYVATCPENNISFYANNGQGGVVGVRVYPDGRKVLENPDFAKPAPRTIRARKEGYMQFRNAFGYMKCILASHAVFIAWSKDPQTEGPDMLVQHLYEKIPAGMTIDHINGVITDNDIHNLRCISLAINNRDGGFLRKLRNKGINPPTIQRPYLLRYYDRMAIVKSSIKSWRYDCLDKSDLEILLYCSDQAAAMRFYQKYNLKINFQSCPTTSENCGA